MKQTVHILATVRKPELIDAALLVFRTLRVGFPEAEVKVWGNGLDGWSEMLVLNQCELRGASFRNLPPTSHDAWIESLIEESTEPFWICDTDIVFWEAVQEWFTAGTNEIVFAGRFEPWFHEEWTDTYHAERLHTCLMWIHPQRVRTAMREFMSRIPAPWGNTADFPFIRQHIIPLNRRVPIFYDTCAGLYHAVQGAAFTEPMNQCFDHLHCATYADALENKAFEEMHQRVYKDINAARGIREMQEKYYASRMWCPVVDRRSKRKEACAV